GWRGARSSFCRRIRTGIDTGRQPQGRAPGNVASLVRPHLRGALAYSRIPVAARLGGIPGLLLELGDQVEADRLVGLQVAAAVEVGGIIGAARPVVDGGLRISAQRARTAGAGGEDAVRRHVLLDPAHHRLEQGLWLRADAAAAMPDARCQEEAEPRP